MKTPCQVLTVSELGRFVLVYVCVDFSLLLSRGLFSFFFVIWIMALTPGDSEKHIFSFLGRWMLNFLQNWFDQYEIKRKIKVLILTKGALHLWGFYLRAEWRIGEVWGSKICVYPTLSVSVLLCGDNLQFLPCMFPISPFILTCVSNHNFPMLFFSLL